jgi:maltooligosyltrehalose synthase
MSVVGPAENHVLSFARQFDLRCVISVVPLHFYRLSSGTLEPMRGAPRADWHGTRLVLPEIECDVWTCALSGQTFEPRAEDGTAMVDVGPLFDVLPVALLTAESP